MKVYKYTILSLLITLLASSCGASKSVASSDGFEDNSDASSSSYNHWDNRYVAEPTQMTEEEAKRANEDDAWYESRKQEETSRIQEEDEVASKAEEKQIKEIRKELILRTETYGKYIKDREKVGVRHNKHMDKNRKMLW